MWFGSGTYEPTPVYKNITADFLKKIESNNLKVKNLFTMAKLNTTIFIKNSGKDIILDLCKKGIIKEEGIGISTGIAQSGKPQSIIKIKQKNLQN